MTIRFPEISYFESFPRMALHWFVWLSGKMFTDMSQLIFGRQLKTWTRRPANNFNWTLPTFFLPPSTIIFVYNWICIHIYIYIPIPSEGIWEFQQNICTVDIVIVVIPTGWEFLGSFSATKKSILKDQRRWFSLSLWSRATSGESWSCCLNDRLCTFFLCVCWKNTCHLKSKF